MFTSFYQKLFPPKEILELRNRANRAKLLERPSPELDNYITSVQSLCEENASQGYFSLRIHQKDIPSPVGLGQLLPVLETKYGQRYVSVEDDTLDPFCHSAPFFITIQWY